MPYLRKYGLKIGVWAATDPKSAACVRLPESDHAIKFTASPSVGQTCPIYTSTVPMPSVTTRTAMKLGIGIIHELPTCQDSNYLYGDLRITVLFDGVEVGHQYILVKDQGNPSFRTFSRLQISPTQYQQLFLHCAPDGGPHKDQASPPKSRCPFQRPVNSGIKFTEAAFENAIAISRAAKNGTVGVQPFRDLWPLPPMIPQGHSMVEVIVTAGIARPGRGYHPPRSINSLSLDPKGWLESIVAEIQQGHQKPMVDVNHISCKAEILKVQSDDSTANRDTIEMSRNTGQNMPQGMLPPRKPSMLNNRPLVIHSKIFGASGKAQEMEPDMEFWGRLHICRSWIYIVPPTKPAEPARPITSRPRPQLILKFRVPAHKLEEIIRGTPRTIDEGYGTSSISPEIKKSSVVLSSQCPLSAVEGLPASGKMTNPAVRYSPDIDTNSSRLSTPSKNIMKPRAKATPDADITSNCYSTPSRIMGKPKASATLDTDTTYNRHTTPFKNAGKPEEKATPKKLNRQTPPYGNILRPAESTDRVHKKLQQKKKLDEGLVLSEIKKGTNIVAGQVGMRKDSSTPPKQMGYAPPAVMQQMGYAPPAVMQQMGYAPPAEMRQMGTNSFGGKSTGVRNLSSSPTTGRREVQKRWKTSSLTIPGRRETGIGNDNHLQNVAEGSGNRDAVKKFKEQDYNFGDGI
ncbi:hypothetical protein BZA77DRAFT_294503 [Pyronema omphalodes]|nr:hypothetical protein BZA77DRAFT_294503 [Pyronema omphalodes]